MQKRDKKPIFLAVPSGNITFADASKIKQDIKCETILVKQYKVLKPTDPLELKDWRTSQKIINIQPVNLNAEQVAKKLIDPLEKHTDSIEKQDKLLISEIEIKDKKIKKLSKSVKELVSKRELEESTLQITQKMEEQTLQLKEQIKELTQKLEQSMRESREDRESNEKNNERAANRCETENKNNRCITNREFDN